MTNFARLTDATTGVCSIDGPQSGTITSSASTTYVEGLLVARVGDVVTAGCGHTGTISAASGNIYAEGKRTARKGDPFSGVYSGTITGSASNTGTDNGISGTGS